MVSMGNPKTWIPYMKTKDCSQGFCSAYCPQWCYIIFPPPPPFEFPGDDDHDDSGPNFSPLVIAIIGILASAFLLVSYYAIISKFCKNRDSSSSRTRRRSEGQNANSEAQENQEPSIHEPWYVSNNGLDESLIKSITICKYKKGDCGGLIEGTDCSVCLSEFQEDESLRLLPKCCHAFHVECIDKWLRSHSNCPVCRANITFINPSPLPPPLQETHQNSDSLPSIHRQNENADVAEEEEEEEEVNLGGGREESLQNLAPKNNPIRALSDLGNNSAVEGDTIIEIADDEDWQQVRRSVSMDYLTQTQNSMADMLSHENQDEDFPIRPESVAGSSEQAAESAAEVRKGSHGSRGFHRVMIKRSFSSGRFSFPRRGRGRNVVIPL